jgi:hypothetical protein
MALAFSCSNSMPTRRQRQIRFAAALVLLCLAQTGCVQRRLTIRSNPPGALVYVDNEEIGMTPVATDFIYYGTRQIRLVKDGFETLTVLQPIPAPWYQVFPLDFVAENVVPGEIRDERVLDFNLVPQTIVHGDQLLQRAEDLRRTTQASIPAAPPGAIVGPAVIQPPAAQPPLIQPLPPAQPPFIQPLPGQALPIQPLPALPPAQTLPTQPQSMPPGFMQPLPPTTSPFQAPPRGVLEGAL